LFLIYKFFYYEKNDFICEFLVATSLALSAQNCPSNSTYIKVSCVSGCYSVSYSTGILSIDSVLYKPTEEQAAEIRKDLIRRCAQRAAPAVISAPGKL